MALFRELLGRLYAVGQLVARIMNDVGGRREEDHPATGHRSSQAPAHRRSLTLFLAVCDLPCIGTAVGRR